MIDVQSLKKQVNLLELAGRDTALRRVASSGGGEWAGPCPFCGGRDRFRVQPYHPGGGRWLCRGCTQGVWQDVIDYGRRLYPGLSFGEVCRLLAGGVGINAHSQSVSYSHKALLSKRAPDFRTQSSPDLGAQAPWQNAALRAIEICEGLLWRREGQTALDYLRRRGLDDETLRYWRLGYSSGFTLPFSPEGEGGEGSGGLYLPRGVLIPCLALDEVWYLKIALLPGERVKCQGCRQPVPARQPCPQCGTINKYRGVKGNRANAIFGADELRGADLALFVEGEFDAMIAWQELNDVIAVCTLGGAGNRPDFAVWGASLLPLEHVLALYDADRAGQAGLQALQELSERVLPVHLPPGAKDVNDYHLAGGDLWLWLKAELTRLGLLEET